MDIESALAYVLIQYGPMSVLIFFMIFIFVKYFPFFGRRLKWLKFLVSTTVQDTTPGYSILMSKLTYLINFKIKTLNIKDDCRRNIFQDMLHIRYKVFKKYLEKMRESDFESMSANELYIDVINCLNMAVEEGEEIAVNQGVPKQAIERYRKWTAKNIDFLLKAIELVCFSGIYKSNLDRMDAVYSLYTAMIEIVIAEIERSLHILNGELDGLEYKGFECGKLKRDEGDPELDMDNSTLMRLH